MKTLAKVAVGVALAKGASAVMNRGGSGGGLDGLLQGLPGASSPGPRTNYGGARSPGGGLDQMLGGLLGGGSAGGSLGQGGLGQILEQLGGASGGHGRSLRDLIGGLAGSGGAGGLLGGLAGSRPERPSHNDYSFGEVLNSQFDETPEGALTPTADQEAAAALMLRAMIQATKADGELDEAEKSKLVDRLGGDVDAQEAEFVQAEFQRPLDIDGLVADTPSGMAEQVYAMSVLGIDLDSQAEAKYLDRLARKFGLDAARVNAIHEQLGVPTLYA